MQLTVLEISACHLQWQARFQKWQAKIISNCEIKKKNQMNCVSFMSKQTAS